MQLEEGERGLPARWSRHPAGSPHACWCPRIGDSSTRLPQPAGCRLQRPGWPRSPSLNCMDTAERSGGGKAGVAQSKDPVESPATSPVGEGVPPSRTSADVQSASDAPPDSGRLQKFVAAGRRDRHAGRARSPDLPLPRGRSESPKADLHAEERAEFFPEDAAGGKDREAEEDHRPHAERGGDEAAFAHKLEGQVLLESRPFPR